MSELVDVVTVIHRTNCADMNVEPLPVDLGEQSPDDPGNATRRGETPEEMEDTEAAWRAL